MNRSSTLLAEKKQRPRTAWLHPTRVLVSVALVAVAAVLVWIIPLRPTESAFEQRELAKFPAFSWDALTSGSYFDDISLWFSDTFPARETFVQMSSGIRRCFGLQGETIHGTMQEGDDIPDAPIRPTSTATTTVTTTATTTVTTTTATTVTTTTTVPTTAVTAEKNETNTTVDPAVLQQNQSLGAIIVKGDTAYEYYNFVRSAADQYIGILNRAGAKLEGANVYSMIVPTSIDVMLEPDARPSNSSDQQKAIAYMVGSLSDLVTPVEVRDALLAHRNEYLYFHTDHHWTARGAYYAFAEFAQLKGKTPPSLSAFEEKAFPGFLGSFYSQTQNAGLKLGGDTVYAYKPQGNISMTRGKTVASATNYPLISDVTNWNSRAKYSAFIGGDNAYSCITNADITDGSSIALIKESYGNAFAPFLSTVYHKVYVIDFRYFTEDFPAFVKNNGVQDVLFLNNISATRNKTLVNKLDSFIGK